MAFVTPVVEHWLEREPKHGAGKWIIGKTICHKAINNLMLIIC